MLKIIDEKEMRTEESIEQEYKGCMFIMINYTDLRIRGDIYIVSVRPEIVIMKSVKKQMNWSRLILRAFWREITQMR